MGKARALDDSLRFLNGAWASLALLGGVLLFEGPSKILAHDYLTPSYVHHHHHVCHVLTMTVAAATWWWVLVLVALARNRDALQFKWAQRLFGFPVLVLAVVGSITGYYVYVTIDTHDEVTYAGVMSVAMGCLLLVQTLTCFSITQYPLREEKDYAWNLLAFSALFVTAFFGIFAYNDIRVPAVLSGTSAALLLFGLWRAKWTIVQKTL